jgi:hypothetical protein
MTTLITLSSLQAIVEARNHAQGCGHHGLHYALDKVLRSVFEIHPYSDWRIAEVFSEHETMLFPRMNSGVRDYFVIHGLILGPARDISEARRRYARTMARLLAMDY